MSAAEVEPDPTPGQCSRPGCEKPSRARGLCDTDYRREQRRERGVGGIEPMDGAVYKIRVRAPHGTQPYYYSNRAMAYAAARDAQSKGVLLYFTKYVRGEDLLDTLSET